MDILLLKSASMCVPIHITPISLTICATYVHFHAPRAPILKSVSPAILDITFTLAAVYKAAQLSLSLPMQTQIESVVQLYSALRVTTP